MSAFTVLFAAFLQVACLIIGAAKYGVWGGVLVLVAILVTTVQAAAIWNTPEDEEEKDPEEVEDKDGEQVEQDEDMAD